MNDRHCTHRGHGYAGCPTITAADLESARLDVRTEILERDRVATERNAPGCPVAEVEEVTR